MYGELGAFYPERFPASRILDYYAARFDAVELNNAFYRLPTEKAVEAWHDATPDDFRFAVRGRRFLTHMNYLGAKMGPVLWQLPPFWEVHVERLDTFLKLLPAWHGTPVSSAMRRGITRKF